MNQSEPDSVLIRYGELSLKQNNRPDFERQLVDNLRESLKGMGIDSVRRLKGAIRVHLGPDSPLDQVINRLSKTPGIAWFGPGKTVERDLETVAETALEMGRDKIEQSDTFGVATQRSDKSYQHETPGINAEVGGIIDEKTSLNVDLDDPDWTVNIHVLHDAIQVFFERHEGLQGLPVGTTGRVLTQLSGGIDSPVAAVEMFKRGCENDFIHFYPYSRPEQALDELMEPLVNQLAPFSTGGRLFLAPYYPFDLGTSELGEDYTLVLFRRHVLRVCERLAHRHDHGGIVTGDSLGQVASQTMENLSTITSDTDALVLQPLIGMNKNEIIRRAKRYGTFELSTQHYKDCCSIQSNHPKTLSDPRRIRSLEARHDLESIDDEVMEEIAVYQYDSQGIAESKESVG
jgi:thiamine biosynthesis protein ThiI